MIKFKPILPRRKNLLNEAYAWERQEGKSLPTLAEVQAAYDAKMREAASLDPEDEDHEYTDDADLPEPYDPNEDEDDMFEEAKPDFLDLDNDNNKDEPMKKAAKDAADSKNLKESFNKRMIGNLKGSEYILSETFKRK